jgi:low temperature requirement protein LtrA
MSGIPALPWHRPMSGRDPEEPHRTSTPLELFFDLCFVVAVAAAAATLHHDLALGHLDGLVGYAMVFFAIWWAWVNYSWFASAYDSDDIVFRLLTFVVMAGVLVVAAGTPRAAEHQDFGMLVFGYVIMRLAMVPLWLRVAREHPGARRTAHRYAVGITVIQALWILRTVLFGHDMIGGVLFAALVLLEMAVPYWAEHVGSGTPWHRHHIAERNELFTIIVLGEVLLATTQAISATLDEHGLETQKLLLIVGGLLIVFSMWWFYFKRPMVDSLNHETAFIFGYAHYFVFASAAAVGACLAVLIEVIEHHAEISSRPAVLLLAAAASVYLLVISGLHSLGDRALSTAVPALTMVVVMGAIGLLGLAPGTSVLLLGLALATSLADHLRRASRDGQPSMSK